MNLENQKIWQFAQANEDILKYLFKYDFESQDMNEYLPTIKHYAHMSKYEIHALENTDWICRFNIFARVILGVDKHDETARCITNTGEIGIFCETFASVPYEMIRRDMLEDESTDDYLLSYPQFKQALLKYEKWAKENGIDLDKHHIYHDENGVLFKEFFELRI